MCLPSCASNSWLNIFKDFGDGKFEVLIINLSQQLSFTVAFTSPIFMFFLANLCGFDHVLFSLYHRMGIAVWWKEQSCVS